MRKSRQPIFAEFRSDGVIRSIQPFEVYNGTEGDDTHTGTGQDDTLNGNGGNDTLSGGDGGDLIDGGEGDDVLSGDGGDDLVRGGVGNDTIISTAGADTIDGGEGTDRWIGSYASATGAFTFDQRTGTLSNGATLTGIESIKLTTGSGADQFTMTGDQAFSIDAGYGIDAFTFDPTGGSRSAAPLVVTIGRLNSTLKATLQDGAVSNTVAGVEHLMITGSSADDLFEIAAGNLVKHGLAIAVDGGGGVDGLIWNLSSNSSTTFIVHRDGTVETNVATVANFEFFDLTFGYGTNIVTLGDGNDRVTTAGSDTIKGGAGDDVINALGSFTQAQGDAGSDTIYSFGTNNIISGNSGDDIISSLGDHTTIDGGLGFDQWSTTLRGHVTYNQAEEELSNGTTLANIESVSLTTALSRHGTTFNLSKDSALALVSRSYNDKITIDLGTVDHAVVLTVTADTSRNGHLLFGGTDITIDAYKFRVPVITVMGTNFDDTVTLNDLDSNFLLPTIDGGEGFDTLGIHLSAASQFVVANDGTITSTFGHYANFEQFDIAALGGANVIALAGGDDVITVVATSTDANALSGGGGDDRITAAQGADRLEGGDGDDQLRGGEGADTLNGGLGDDLLDGGAGIDIAGYYGATSGVTVAIVAGAQDTGGAGIDTLTSIENLYGSEFNDTLTGDDLANTLRGREGDDVLNGGGGADRLDGGPGADRLTGGAGADAFVFTKLTDISLGVRDRILDFSHADGDRIDLSSIDLSKDPGDQQFTFIGTSAFTGADDIFELRIREQPNGYILVEGDVNHDAKGDFIIAVYAAGTPLVAADFVL